MKKFEDFVNSLTEKTSETYRIYNHLNKFVLKNNLQTLKSNDKCLISYDKDYQIENIYIFEGEYDDELAQKLININKADNNISETVSETVYTDKIKNKDNVLIVYDYDSGKAYCLYSNNLKDYILHEKPIRSGEPLQYKIIPTIKITKELVNSKAGIIKYNL